MDTGQMTKEPEGQPSKLDTTDSAQILHENGQRETEMRETSIEKVRKENIELQKILGTTLPAADFVDRINNIAGSIPVWVKEIRKTLTLQQETVVNKYLDYIDQDTNGLLRDAEQLRKLLLSKRVYRLAQLILDEEEHWEIIRKKLKELTHKRDLETRVEETMRLDDLISETEAKFEQSEERLVELEAELSEIGIKKE